MIQYKWGYMVNSAKKKGAMIKRAFKKRRHGKTRYDIHSHPYENTLIVKSMYMSNVHISIYKCLFIMFAPS